MEEYSAKDECGNWIQEPIKLIGLQIDASVQARCHNHEPHGERVANDGGCLRLIQENRDEEGGRDLSKVPAHQGYVKQELVGLLEHVKLKDHGADENEDKYCDVVDEQIETEVHQPVVKHAHPIDFHSFKQLFLFLKYNEVQKDWEAETQTSGDHKCGHDTFGAL